MRILLLNLNRRRYGSEFRRRFLCSRPDLAQRLEQVSDDALRINQGTLYPALLRLEQRGWITSKWGTSDNNRRARFYTLTPAGRRQLRAERTSWHLLSGIINKLLASEE